ncbi:hypothetical protein ACFXB3_07170 [Streptomyces sp. NPDC059447]|uniref:hypothetical protein n=1 Tax=Streptomyces sp. NPDC059447 TaxID=3346834 RepID=UPI003674E8ED
MTELLSHTLDTSAGPITVDATEPTPGLRIFETPTATSPAANRWILAHHGGVALASFTTHADAQHTAEQIAPLADWTKTAITAANQISLGGHTNRLMDLLRDAGGQHPNA